MIERGQKQVSGVGDTPLIQFNQQTNEVNIGSSTTTLSRDSRERVKSAVLGLLGDLTAAQEPIIDDSNLVVVEETEGDGDNAEE